MADSKAGSGENTNDPAASNSARASEQRSAIFFFFLM